MPSVLLLLLLLLLSFITLPELSVKPTALHMLAVAVDHMQLLKFVVREEYSYSIHKILQSIDLTACRETNKAKNNMRDCFFYFYILSLWNTPFFKSLQMAIAYFWYRLFNYTPYSGYLKLRKVSSIIAIPFIKLFKDRQ